MIYRGDYRTAPATPGLLIMCMGQCHRVPDMMLPDKNELFGPWTQKTAIR